MSQQQQQQHHFYEEKGLLDLVNDTQPETILTIYLKANC